MRFRTRLVRTIVLATVALVAAGQAGAQDLTTGIRPVEFGEKFPALTFETMAGGTAGPARVDLGTVLGKKPVILVYWIAGHPRSDAIVRQVQDLTADFAGDPVAVYAVALERPGREKPAILAAAREIGLTLPILDDEGFRIGQMLRVQSVPHVALIDREGRLRLANGAAMGQTLGYKVTLESAIRSVARTGQVGTYGYLPMYHPVNELVGKKCPDFSAPFLGKTVEQDWSSMMKDDQLNVLIFWSVECPHCRTSLPKINEWLRANGTGVNVISAASVSNQAIGTKTQEFCEANDFVFPTLADRNLEISNLYQVTSTPTILVIRPDGVVDSVLDPAQDFGEAIARKRKEILGS